jgi:hypothetical protein
MALGQSSLAGFARVSFEAVTGEFNVDVAKSEQVYRDATRGMSDEAIRLELSQDKLRRALAKGPAAFREQARAELQVRNSERALRGETDALARSQDRQRRTMSGLRASAIGYASAFLGGAGVLFAIKSSLAAAREEELVLGQTQVALEAAGLSWERYGKRIETVIKAQSALGFDDEALLKTFQLFVRSTKDVDEALSRNALAADVARGRYMDLESAAKLVVKASLGQAGALRRVGIDAKQGATGVELITLLTEQYGQAAEKASKTGIAAQDRLNVAVENLKEALGRGLSPTVTEYTDKLTKWLDTAEHQEELQRRVNEAVETGEAVVKGFVAVMDRGAPVVEKVAGALGGLDRVIETVLVLGILRKSQRALGGLRALAGGFGLVGASALRAEATSVGALGGIGAAATGATGKVAGLRAGLLGLAGLGPIAIAFAASVPDVVPSGGGKPGTITTVDDFEGLLRMARDGRLPPATIERLEELGTLTPKQIAQLRRAAQSASSTAIERGEKMRRAAARQEAPQAGESAGGARPGRSIADIQLDLARAGTTASSGDDLRYHRELRARYQRQADALERRKNLSAKQKELLRSLYGQLASEQSAIDSIISEGERKLAEQREKAREKRERLREAAEAKQKRLDEFYGRRAAAHRIATLRPLRESGGAGVKGAGKGTKDGEKGLTRAELNAALFEYTTSLHGLTSQWGDNYASDGGQAATHLYAQTELLRSLDSRIAQLIAGAGFSGTAFARADLAAAGMGAGF